MKIGFDAKRLLNNRTGLGNYSRTLVSNLIQYHPTQEYYLYSPTEGIEEFRKQFSKDTTLVYPKKQKPLYRTLRVKKDINKADIDIYHGLSHELPRRLHKISAKTVVTIHDLIFKMHPEYFPAMDRQFYHLKCKHSLANADKVIAISQSTKDDIIKYYGIKAGKIDVIYQPCDPMFYRQITEDDTNTIRKKHNLPDQYYLSVGSIEPRKNHVTLLKSYAKLDKAIQYPLLIIGNGGIYKKQILQLIASLNLQHKVFLISGIPSTDLPSIYKLASLFIYPSFYEGFGLPVVESMLSGTPVITSKTSSLQEAGGPYSHYITPTDALDLTRTIESIITNTEKRKHLGEQSKQYALKTFDPEMLTGQMMTMYKSLLSV